MKGINAALPGSFGMNTQSDVVDEQGKRYVSDAANGVIDDTGKLVSRKDFALQTSGSSVVLEALYNHRTNLGTEVMMSAGEGVIYSGIGTLSARFDYRSGSQIVDVGGAKSGASATGLTNDATQYTYQISVDGGGAQTINVTGSTAQSYTNLLTQIQADITGATVALVGGNLKFISNTTGASSSISLSSGGGGTNLFTALTNFVAVRTAVAGTTTNNSWAFASLNSRIFFAQKNQALTCLLETDFSVESITNQPWTSSPNVLISADGRLWAADDETAGNRHTIWWSGLLDGKVWTGSDAGNIDLREVWPTGQDFIVALAFLSGRLIILGRSSILMYTLPADHDPANMSLTDTIPNLGCDSRDSVMLAGGDLYFKSDDGYYKLPKLAQVTTLPVPVKISRLVGDEFNASFASETMTKVRAGYNPTLKHLVLTAPTAVKTWCFHVDRLIPDVDTPPVTYWTNTGIPFRAFAFDKDKNFYCAKTNGVGMYTGYTPDDASNAYSFDVYGQWDGMGDETRLKNMKNLDMTLKAAAGQIITFRWQFDYKTGTTRTAAVTASSAEFSDGIGVVKSPIGGSGNVIRIGFTTSIDGDKVEYVSMRWYGTPGKTIAR